MMTDPRWGELYVRRRLPSSWIERLVVESPARLVWAGDAAVAVFFVLSGYVLARPFLHGQGERWSRYYQRRLVRLYLPVWAALAATALLLQVVPRVHTGYSWLDVAQTPMTWGDVTLWHPSSFLGQLWSLRWEVAFSLALPLYVASARWLGRFGLVGLAPTILLEAGAYLGGAEALMYLLVFALGCQLAAIEAAANRRHVPPALVAVAAVVAIAALTSRSYPLLALGALITVAVVLCSRRATRLLSTPLAEWLGRVSFSLYLVHLPIVLAWTRAPLPGWATAAAAVATSLLVAPLFYRLVEAPAQRLARRAGGAAQTTIPAAAEPVLVA